MTTNDQEKLLERFADEHHPMVKIGRMVGIKSLNALMEHFGSEEIYFPTPERFWSRLQRDLRNHEICLKYNGKNGLELCEEYQICPRTLRRVVKSGHGFRDMSALCMVSDT